MPGDKTLTYYYDATGRKLSQALATSSTVTKKTDYANEYIYENDTLQFINTAEGRYVANAGAVTGGEYQYHLKDHLGNVRLTFTTKREEDIYTATFENSTQNSEQNTFQNYSRVDFDLMDHTDAGTTLTHAQLLNGGNNSQVGLAKTLSVVPGDTIKVETYVKYRNATSNPGNLTAFAAALTSAFGLSSGGTGEAAMAFDALDSYGAVIASGVGHEENEYAPKAYLNILHFDKDYNLVDMAFKQLSEEAEQVHATNKEPHEYLSREFIASQAGYVYIFVSNENPTQVDVYFDDIKITHTKSPVIQSDDYYPFGLAFNSYSRENTEKNKYLYNGIERQGELDLNWDLAFYRTYDATICRWHQVDPKASERESPYVGLSNNPILFSDFLGDEVDSTRTKGKNVMVVANKDLRKKDIQSHMPKKGPFKKLRAALSSAYAMDNIKARMMQVLSLGKLKVVSAGSASEAVSKIKSLMGDDGYVKNLTIDFHVGRFGEDDFDSPATLSTLGELADGYAGEETTVYLGNCWAGGNEALGHSDLTKATSEALDGATTYGNQAAASSISFFFANHFEGIIPTAYSKNPDNVAAIGNHTVSDPTGSCTTTDRIKIGNSGRIKVKQKQR